MTFLITVLAAGSWLMLISAFLEFMVGMGKFLGNFPAQEVVVHFFRGVILLIISHYSEKVAENLVNKTRRPSKS